ncbi:helix-turn-helix domain-containing protein [Rhodococcoides yunnanense]|uniref:helix-turn-helix domain-containing protein n=1 Tax=Rhodococcoides yunnanense TaxID=278209 RepID=UPI000934EFFB|nr:helix-turn-helix transcriptional regulator [Rhodococcus yunnanensis]
MSTPLGDFLRARRDSTSPQSLGLTGGGRRRVPGVRRSELAALAGISVEYLIRIEQGRDRNPSPQIVRALADSLDLDAGEREHLRNLTKITAGACSGGRAVDPLLTVRPAVASMIRLLEPGIAFLTNRIGDLLAWTDTFDLVAGPCGLLDNSRPNLTRFVFVDERARTVFPEWNSLADECAFDLWTDRSASLVQLSEPSASLLEELSAEAGDELTRRLNGNSVPERGRLTWTHPDVGPLHLDREVLELPAADNQQLVVLLPADDRSAEAIRTLRAQASLPLRAVN